MATNLSILSPEDEAMPSFYAWGEYSTDNDPPDMTGQIDDANNAVNGNAEDGTWWLEFTNISPGLHQISAWDKNDVTSKRVKSVDIIAATEVRSNLTGPAPLTGPHQGRNLGALLKKLKPKLARATEAIPVHSPPPNSASYPAAKSKGASKKDASMKPTKAAKKPKKKEKSGKKGKGK